MKNTTTKSTKSSTKSSSKSTKSTKSSKSLQPAKVIEKENVELANSLAIEIENNPKYSLLVDPENKYGMNDLQKEFIRYYIEFKNIHLAAELCGLDITQAKEIFSSYSTQSEIRRINLALYHRQFQHKMLTIEQLGGWLSSLITDENVPVADRLKTTEKLKVAQMLIDMNDFKQNAFDNPNIIMVQNIETELKNLSVNAIKQLIYTTNIKSDDEKDKVLEQLQENNTYTPEEVAYLKTLSINELLKYLDISINNNEEENK